MRSITVEMEYIGKELSCNHYKFGYFTKRVTKDWMDALGWQLLTSHIEEWDLPLTVICSGRFRDKRSQPDLHNLMKVICDSIEEVTGINDRYFRTETGDGIIDKTQEPTLYITITEATDD